ncbi:peptidase [Bacillus methanolicus]|uniref:head maturation protease, ClpP-related n=1 Tax=Bacillus methanolicus TaxID=1471 RepID=UPI00237FFC61|nr:head maturation protease, ClpP-related [Bacillus methanolicus]MDE3838654.1 peptidase [Bacillus methanolicus]
MVKNKFLEIKNQTDNSADLYFYGDIVSSWLGAWDDTDQYPEAIRDFLKGVEGKNLNIYINSGGGSVFAGMAIYNMLKRHQGFKTVYVDGLAASISSVIALAGDRVIVPSNAFLMIHKPWSWSSGNANDFRKLANDLDAIEEGIMNVYAENIKEGVDIEVIRQMVQEETWLNGLEAEKYFNIEVTEPNEAVACVSDYFKNYQRIPDVFKQHPKNEHKADKTQTQINQLLMELELI